MNRLEQSWHHPRWFTWLLLPLSGLFCLLGSLRRVFYRVGLLRSWQAPVPVIVVGNITVGGTGKTPLVIALVELLRQQGWRPGVISRGYGGIAERWPQRVDATSDSLLIGDEPLLIARRTGAPLVVGPDRVADAQELLSSAEVDIIICDDGLQHYRLRRDVEIVMIDGQRGNGNGHCLPAGPLREPSRRLRSVDMVVVNGGGGEGIAMRLEPQAPRAVVDESQERPLESFVGQPVHALAGIGNPQRFFSMLQQRGLSPMAHPFPDHHRYLRGEIDFADTAPVLMTEKDAVKCSAISDQRHWYIPVTAQLPEAFAQQLQTLLEKR